jgi:two-component system phosphate regulon sensor histidine kinase PhoR
VFEDLNTNARTIMSFLSSDEAKFSDYLPSNEEIRITLINREGTVLYDSDATASEMENHNNRPEIKAAFLDGEGKAIRFSNTLKRNTYYYALQLDDNTVLRVAKDTDSILSMF